MGIWISYQIDIPLHRRSVNDTEKTIAKGAAIFRNHIVFNRKYSRSLAIFQICEYKNQ